jgi:hypothetical protein
VRQADQWHQISQELERLDIVSMTPNFTRTGTFRYRSLFLLIVFSSLWELSPLQGYYMVLGCILTAATLLLLFLLLWNSTLQTRKILSFGAFVLQSNLCDAVSQGWLCLLINEISVKLKWFEYSSFFNFLINMKHSLYMQQARLYEDLAFAFCEGLSTSTNHASKRDFLE